MEFLIYSGFRLEKTISFKLLPSQTLHLILGFHLIIYAQTLCSLWVQANVINYLVFFPFIYSSHIIQQVRYRLPFAYYFRNLLYSFLFLFFNYVAISYLLFSFFVNFIIKYSGLFYSSQFISVFEEVFSSFCLLYWHLWSILELYIFYGILSI